MIRLSGASKRYDGRAALEPTTIELAAHRTTVLIGPSGSGKSTILRILLGLVRPDDGRVEIDGEVLSPASALRLRRRMGYVRQGGGLFPHLTARGNVELMARQVGWPSDRIASRTADLTELTHFPLDGLDRYPAQLSGGQRQRVSLMRALMLDPDLLLLDEPLGALDPLIRSELQNDLKHVFDDLGKTVVLVTHDLPEAVFFADTIVLLRSGSVVQAGPAGELLRNPADDFVRQFVHAQRSLHKGLEA